MAKMKHKRPRPPNSTQSLLESPAPKPFMYPLEPLRPADGVDLIILLTITLAACSIWGFYTWMDSDFQHQIALSESSYLTPEQQQSLASGLLDAQRLSGRSLAFPDDFIARIERISADIENGHYKTADGELHRLKLRVQGGRDGE